MGKLWTLTLIGEPGDGGTSSARWRVPAEAHDELNSRLAIEHLAEERFALEHPGHPIIAEWWNYEEVRES